MSAGIRIVTANLDYTRDGDRRYLTYLRSTYDPAVACLQEVERGIKGTRVRGWGVEVHNKRRRTIGKRGAHRAVAVGGVDLAGSKKRLRVESGHAPHKGTVGVLVHSLWLTGLAAWTRTLNARRVPWVLGIDSNHRHKAVARMLGGVVYGHGTDAIIASKMLELSPVTVDWHGVDQGWTDHPAVVARVSLAGAR